MIGNILQNNNFKFNDKKLLKYFFSNISKDILLKKKLKYTKLINKI